jgi:hypothetical protein
MTAAYNVQTKEARIYVECERMNEKIIEESMCSMGAGSVIIDSLSSGDWETTSAIALNSVIKCGDRDGFSLIRSVTAPRAAGNTGNARGSSASGSASAGGVAAGGSGGMQGDDDDDGSSSGEEKVPPPRSSGSTNTEHKRKRNPSAPDLDDRVRNSDMFNLMRTVYQDSRCKRDDVSDLREKVVILKYELTRANEKVDDTNKVLIAKTNELAQEHTKTVCAEVKINELKAEVSRISCESNVKSAKIREFDELFEKSSVELGIVRGELEQQRRLTDEVKKDMEKQAEKLGIELNNLRQAKVSVLIFQCMIAVCYNLV